MKFKVGDKVRIRGLQAPCVCTFGPCNNGDTFTVLKVCDEGFPDAVVMTYYDLDTRRYKGNNRPCCFSSLELEPVKKYWEK